MKNLIFNRSKFAFQYNEWLSDEILSESIIISSCPRDLNSFKKVYINSQMNTQSLMHILEEIFTKYKIERIFSNSEDDFMLVDDLKEKFGISDNHTNRLSVFKDKILMKNLFSNSGIKVPKFKVLTSPGQLLKESSNFLYPIILKPSNGTGSKGVNKIVNYQSFKMVLTEKLDYPLLIEEFVDKQLYHADGIIINGSIEHLYISKYDSTSKGALSMLSDGYLGSILIDNINPLYEKVSKALIRISKEESQNVFPFHFEFFYEELYEEIVACEIACRIGGPRIFETIEQIKSVNLNEIWLKSFFGLELDKNPEENNKYGGWIIYSPTGNRLSDFSTTCPFSFVTSYVYRKNKGEFIQSVESSSDYIFGISFEAQNENNATERINLLKAWLKDSIVTI